MKRLMIVAVALMAIAGCTNERNRGGSDVGAITSPGFSGGATGTPSGVSNDPLGSGGGPPGTAGIAKPGGIAPDE